MSLKNLGDVLVEDGIIDKEELAGIKKIQEKSNLDLAQIIIKKGLAQENDILRSIAGMQGLEFHEKIEFGGFSDVFKNIPLKLIQKSRMVPFAHDKKKVKIALADPMDLHPMDDIKLFLKDYQVEFVVTTEPEISRIIHNHFESGETREMMDEFSDFSELEENADENIDLSNEAPIIRMVNVILSQAVTERASDIHIEPFEKNLIVRYRIDGILHKVLTPPKAYQMGISTRIKIMSNLNIAENRLPQDGRIKIRVAGKDIDIRVSFIPCQYGERIVMRILNKSDQSYSVSSIGFNKKMESVFREVITEPHGIILITGPTGSGKTTTLYSALSELNTEEKNIITCEDPVEYQIQGISQMHMQEKIGLTFASGLRSILRQDPDIIMVGEIRDEETARIAIQASLTGHLVFSTLHTNDAASAVTRLADMGIESYLITSTVLAFMAQRLVRVICPSCKKPYAPQPKELDSLGMSKKELKNRKFYKGQGCDKCMQTGYKGRAGIYELLIMNDEIKKAVLKGSDASEINSLALKNGMVSLRESGKEKILEGITTSEEVLRVT